MDYTITNNEFNTITNSHEREMLKNAYDAINASEAWDWLKNFNQQSFMFSLDPMVNKISENMEKLGYNGHSGASFGWTMRNMEYLAKNGKTKFFSHYIG